MDQTWICIGWILGISSSAFPVMIRGSEAHAIIERFEYKPEAIEGRSDCDKKFEFLVIGKPVSWREAQILCPSYVRDYHDTAEDDVPSSSERNGHLAILDGNYLAKWLARMLAESDYRYEGLWIGGNRERENGTWTWIKVREDEEGNAIPEEPSGEGFPPWYKTEDPNFGKNCLAFDKQGHESPLFVQEDCRLRRPFVCQKISARSPRDLPREGRSVELNGIRYTMYHFFNDDVDGHESIERINGGGIEWGDAMFECHRRGEALAIVSSNEAAAAIADLMLKSRPSMESAWLGGWSADGTEWTWVSSGDVFPSVKSNLTEYPPWMEENTRKLHRRKETRCLILDRHLCPLHVTPVFLDSDCRKKRPFVCQAVQSQRLEDRGAKFDEEFIAGGKAMRFSKNRMTWGEGKAHCEDAGSVLARINDSQTLNGIVERMATLSLDHAWIGGRTQFVNGDWKWLDADGEEGVELDGPSGWWCNREDPSGRDLPDGKPDLCLNLDREGRGQPILYGLKCDGTRQHVLCARKKEHDEVEEEEEEANGSGLGLNESAESILRRIGQIVGANSELGFLFVLDDSMSVLNSWFVEQLKLSAIIVQTVFRVSAQHPMGMITFSTETSEAISMNETDECHALSSLANQVLVSRGADWNDRLENRTSRETTDIKNAAMHASRILRDSKSPRNIVLFITDGENTEEEPEAIRNRGTAAAVEEMRGLRNLGHETLALLITQGRSQGGLQDRLDYKTMEELFPNSPNGDKNLFVLEDYRMLGELVSTLNATLSSNSTTCEQPHWIVPEDHRLLAHLLNRK